MLCYIGMADNYHKFKHSQDSNFCTRGRYLAQHHVLSQETGLRYDIRFQVDPNSVSLANHEVSFEVRSVFEEDNPFTGVLSVYEGGVLHFLLQEKQPICPRYRIPWGEVINPSQLHPVKDLQQACRSEDKLEYVSDDYRVSLTFLPLKVETYFQGQLVIVINDRCLLNLERYRRQDNPLPILASHTDIIPILDGSQAGPCEGLWEEEFAGERDVKKGPSSVAVEGCPGLRSS